MYRSVSVQRTLYRNILNFVSCYQSIKNHQSISPPPSSPSPSDNGGLGSFYRGAKLSLDSINSSSEWNGVKSGVGGGGVGAAANFSPDEIKGGRDINSIPPPPPPLPLHPHMGGGVASMAAGSSQSLEEWGRMDDFGLAPETHPDGRKSNFYRSRSFSMLDHVGQVKNNKYHIKRRKREGEGET